MTKPLYLLLSLILIYSCNNPEEGRLAPVDSVRSDTNYINIGAIKMELDTAYNVDIPDMVTNVFDRSMGQINELIELCRIAQRQRDSIYRVLQRVRMDRYSSDGEGITLAPGESMSFSIPLTIDTTRWERVPPRLEEESYHPVSIKVIYPDTNVFRYRVRLPDGAVVDTFLPRPNVIPDTVKPVIKSQKISNKRYNHVDSLIQYDDAQLIIYKGKSGIRTVDTVYGGGVIMKSADVMIQVDEPLRKKWRVINHVQ